MDKSFSVLLPLVDCCGERGVLFQVRNKSLRHHGGEISFPGGAVENGENAEQAAVRETSEELGIPESAIELLCGIGGTRALSGSFINCYVGRLGTNSFAPSEDEVETLFVVPLNFLLSASPKLHFLEDSCGNKVESQIYEYDGRVIWGITARLLKNFVDSYDSIRNKL